jgi:glycerophosphoryl diester phosphodiesterase
MMASHGANDGPRFLAHRGYQARYPENTREGLAAAVEAGARNIEFDVQLCRDGVPVLLHDATLFRTAGVDGLVFDLDAAELAAVEVNESERLGGQFTGVTVPLLADIADDLAGWPEVTAFVELKRQSIERFGAAQVVNAVLDVLRPVLGQCVVISFNHDVLYDTRRRAEVPVGWVLREWSAATRATADALQPEYLLVNKTRLPASEPVWPGPWAWVCYDIVDYPRALELHARGIDMISSFDIGQLLEAAHDEGPGA